MKNKNNNINNLFNKKSKNEEKNVYNIKQTKHNIWIYNDKESILLYYLNYYTDIYDDIDFSLNIIEEDIAFWIKLNKCIIIYSNELENYFKKLKNKENSLIVFVNENCI